MALFEVLMLFAKDRELTLLDDGMAIWHLRKDGQLTIYELVALTDAGRQRVLDALDAVPGALNLTARRLAQSPDETWLEADGFRVVSTDTPKAGKRGKPRTGTDAYTLNIWRRDVRRTA